MASPGPTLYLAPLQGFTDWVFRNVFSRHFGGIDLAVSPFLTPRKRQAVKTSQLREVLPENNRHIPLVPQILSKSAGPFIELARALADLGYPEVNWNLGCPFPRVAKKGRGAGLLLHPEQIDRFLDEVLPRIPVSLSVKTRLGYLSNGELDALMPVFNRYPLTAVIIHPRTGIQMYEGEPDLDGFERCLAAAAHPVAYNGEIRTPAVFRMLAARFPQVARWMIGRWVLANPFLPEEIKTGAEPGEHAAERFKAFHDDLCLGYAEILAGPSHLLQRMKGFWRYFAQGFADSRKGLKTIQKAKRMEEYANAVERFLESRTHGSAFVSASGRRAGVQ